MLPLTSGLRPNLVRLSHSQLAAHHLQLEDLHELSGSVVLDAEPMLLSELPSAAEQVGVPACHVAAPRHLNAAGCAEDRIPRCAPVCLGNFRAGPCRLRWCCIGVRTLTLGGWCWSWGRGRGSLDLWLGGVGLVLALLLLFVLLLLFSGLLSLHLSLHLRLGLCLSRNWRGPPWTLGLLGWGLRLSRSCCLLLFLWSGFFSRRFGLLGRGFRLRPCPGSS
mmetsp:Transcript_145824/g.254582  ORF Transcript_145824/g.254582 Transcript_145824/m.254582 type:complete len:220 (-) Transcript_145824:1233-1892(-)